MTRSDATKLADQVRKEAGPKVRVKIGQTNGRFVLHVVNAEASDRREASVNVADAGEWAVSPLNRINRPSKRKAAAEEGLGENRTFTAGE